MKSIRDLLLLALLLAGLVLLAPAAIDAAAGLADRQGLTLNLQQQQQVQNQPQFIIIQPDQVQPHQAAPIIDQAAGDGGPVAAPAATPTANPAVIQANNEAMTGAAACGRRGCPGGRATATPGHGQ
jgi:hypothetical protein